MSLARIKAIDKEKRNDSNKSDTNHVEWKLVYRYTNACPDHRKSARDELEKHMSVFESKFPELTNETALEIVIPKFCDFYGDVQVFVICSDYSLKNYKYTYPESGASLDHKYKIFLFREKVSDREYHIKFIPAIKEYAKCIGGVECIFKCGFVGRGFQSAHKNCKQESCKDCYCVLEKEGHFRDSENNLMFSYHCDGSNDQPVKCSNCQKMVGSENCLKRHKFFKCKTKKKCEKCGLSVQNKKTHICGEIRCRNCKELLSIEKPKTIDELDNYYEAIHQCPYKKAALPIRLPNVGFFSLGIGEQNSCIKCQSGLACELHKEPTGSIKMEVHAVAMSYEHDDCHGKFEIKKWIGNTKEPITEEMKEFNYLTKSLKERTKLRKVLPENVRKKKKTENVGKKKKPENVGKKKKKKKKKPSTPTENQTELQLECLRKQKINYPLWNFLDFILTPDFNNYAFMCDTEVEIKTVLR